MAVHRLLVVEDHDAARRALDGIFTRLGWEVRTARTVGEAIERLEEEPPPCCVLLDLMLPDGDGDAVLRRIREKGLLSRVVVSTGTVLDPARLGELSALGPDAFLQKPITAEKIWDGPCRVCGTGEGG